MTCPNPGINQLVAYVKDTWTKCSDSRISCVGNRLSGFCKYTLPKNAPPLSDTFMEFASLTNLEWKNSTTLQLEKDPSLASKRFCTVLDLDDVKMGFLYLGAQTRYPEHAHAPEEIYQVVAGNCLRLLGPEDEKQPVKSGDVWFHESEEVHGLQTEDSAVLIAWAWTGQLQGSYYFCDTPDGKIDCSYAYEKE